MKVKRNKWVSRKFVIAVGVIVISSVIFVCSAKLAGTEYAAIVIAVVGLYSGSNAYQKKVMGE